MSPNDSTEHRLGTEIVNELNHHVFNSLVFIYIQVRHRSITHICIYNLVSITLVHINRFYLNIRPPSIFRNLFIILIMIKTTSY